MAARKVQMSSGDFREIDTMRRLHGAGAMTSTIEWQDGSKVRPAPGKSVIIWSPYSVDVKHPHGLVSIGFIDGDDWYDACGIALHGHHMVVWWAHLPDPPRV